MGREGSCRRGPIARDKLTKKLLKCTPQCFSLAQASSRALFFILYLQVLILKAVPLGLLANTLCLLTQPKEGQQQI